jgi:hypothetical protein
MAFRGVEMKWVELSVILNPQNGDIATYYGWLSNADFAILLKGTQQEGFICLNDAWWYKGDDYQLTELKDDFYTGKYYLRPEHIIRFSETNGSKAANEKRMKFKRPIKAAEGKLATLRKKEKR